jgi:NifU-like protein
LPITRVRPYPKKEGEIVCECFGITDLEIRRAAQENHLKTIEDVTDYVKAGGGCGNCHERIGEIIAEVRGKPLAVKSQPKVLTNVQKIRMIEETLDREIKPALNQDGGDIELVDFDQNTVFVRLRGTCSTCAASQVTLKSYVETKLKELVSPELVVSEVTQ